MDINQIKELVEIINGSDIAELKIRKDDEEIVIKKPTAFPAQVSQLAPVMPASPQPSPSTSPSAAQSTEELPENYVTVVAPMVGTFYRSPAPEAAPYVEVGDVVETGQPLCIIEAMKLMNEIESDYSGRIVKVLVENAQPVEYGQPLFIIAKGER
jgi:acetyl-CoA carboxylase biotin carboxyl carrier protein